MLRNFRLALLALSLVIALLAVTAAGCGDDNNSSDTTEDTATLRPDPPQPQVQRVKPPAEEAKLNERPLVPKGKGAPPRELVIQDLIVGKGVPAGAGDLLSVQYAGALFKNGKEFDSTWGNSGKPFKFQLGTGKVIPGWEQGVPGMKVGGRRKLIIPPGLAYGTQGLPPAIPPNAALIFDIDLKKLVR